MTTVFIPEESESNQNRKCIGLLKPLGTIVLNSRDQHKIHGVPLLCASTTHLTIYSIRTSPEKND